LAVLSLPTFTKGVIQLSCLDILIFPSFLKDTPHERSSLPNGKASLKSLLV